MNEYAGYELRTVSPNYKISMAEVEKLLNACGLRYEHTDYMVGLFNEENEAIACGGYENNTLKCLAVNENERGTGVFNSLVSHLLQKLYYDGNESINVFTKPVNEQMFVSLGFKMLAKADKAIFMEKGNGIDKYLKSLDAFQRDGINGAIVMNCNPFTKGHLHLAEYASKLCDNLYIFVVSENKSVFPTEVRLELVKKGVSHLKNVIVIEGGRYIISSATFPSYFLKEYSEITKTHTTIDCSLFNRFIVNKLKISRRFVGEELTDRVTMEYNKTMSEMLCENGVELSIIPRLCDENGAAISASNVRRLIAEDRLCDVKKTVPKTTYDFICSDKCKHIIERIKNEYKKH